MGKGIQLWRTGGGAVACRQRDRDQADEHPVVCPPAQSRVPDFYFIAIVRKACSIRFPWIFPVTTRTDLTASVLVGWP